jgi:hypothetical protein
LVVYELVELLENKLNDKFLFKSLNPVNKRMIVDFITNILSLNIMKIKREKIQWELDFLNEINF